MYVYHNWPVRFAWATRWGTWKEWFKWHGVEVGAYHFSWTYHLGPLKLIFGERTAAKYYMCWMSGYRAGRGFCWAPLTSDVTTNQEAKGDE